MPEVVNRAKAVWQGDLFHGQGMVSFDSGALPTVDVSWATRSSKVSGKTNPEELIAAAHATCFAMALSNIIAKEGKRAEKLEVTAEVVFSIGDQVKISESRITVVGKVPGMDQASFEKAAQAAKDGCPVSKALKGNVAISLTAKLE
ncbi:MAG: OsmC family peroxiredoxin [Candidatus Caldarchaeum sp.]|jgi:osmotically inducible protein OsmC|uniref:OsmC family peroxiredoxin n=1 Tax=Caldiarchaeum subterraneum TaxID=311458 RepID=A0A7C4I7T8_CALS0|nr:OsmC family peroxiredoxin [Candidatus Caldarchaeales archaeon]